MVKIRKSCFFLYRKYRLDIWGLYSNNNSKLNMPNFRGKIAQFFSKVYKAKHMWRLQQSGIHIYRIDVVAPKSGFKRSRWTFSTIRLLKLYYISLSHSDFRRYGRMALRKEGLFTANYVFFLEGRVAGMLYRSHFVSNVLLLKEFIMGGNVLVDGEMETFPNLNIEVGSLVSLVENIRSIVRLELETRFRGGFILFNVPRYMVVNYTFMFGFMHRKPFIGDIAFPVAIDVYRGMDYL